MKVIKLNGFRLNSTTITYKQEFLNRQDEYNSLLNKITDAFNTIEYLSVVEGTRDAHLMFLKPHEVESTRKRFLKYGLDVVVLNKEGVDDGRYGNHSLEYDGGPNFIWRSILTKDTKKWKDIWATREHDVLFGEYLIGAGLGYPECCCKFFTEVWMKEGYIDTTWQQALNTAHPTSQNGAGWWNLPQVNTNTVELPNTTPIWASNLLRWAGMKIVPHLPCSFDCKESKRVALENLGLATKYGFGQEYHKLCQMLDWEIKWTAEYGVATIETPIFTITTVTDVTIEKYQVIKHGHNNCIL